MKCSPSPSSCQLPALFKFWGFFKKKKKDTSPAYSILNNFIYYLFGKTFIDSIVPMKLMEVYLLILLIVIPSESKLIHFTMKAQKFPSFHRESTK